MSVKKQKDGRYKAEVYLGKKSSGKKARKTKIFDKQRDAKDWEREMKAKYKTGSMDLDENMILEDYLNYWYETYVEAKTKYNTQKRYKRLLVQVNERIGYLPLSDVKTPIVDRLYSDLMKETTLANGTIVKIHRVFRQAMEQAVGWELLVKNPVHYAKPPKDDVREIETWSMEEADLFFKTLPECQVKLPAYIVYHTGLRQGEVAALRWQDIDFDNEILKVNHNMVEKKGGILELDTPKTDSSLSEVVMTPSLIVALKKVQLEHKKHKLLTGIEMEYVCGWLDGRPLRPNYISRAFKQAIERVNKLLKQEDQITPITFHGLRHTHASILYEVGASSHEISKRLRHSRVSTTDNIYIHMSERKKKDTAAAFESAINKTAK
jgi:integrase